MNTDMLRVPCSYQGGKQRIAGQIVDHLIDAAANSSTTFYDLCCGSGAVSIELVNRGVEPSRITMLDISSWGVFWTAISTGTFNMNIFDSFLSRLPTDKREFKAWLTTISTLPIGDQEAELYPLLQSCSFGGKQIWRNGDRWVNTCFRDYWEPTATSVRRSPANPMQPSPVELRRRIDSLVKGMKGAVCLNMDIMEILKAPLPDNAVVYVDPPYQHTTGYAYDFDIFSFIKLFLDRNKNPLFISERKPLNENAIMLTFGGANGGISGSRKEKHKEWLSRF
ncbi:DNA adenine methylase [Acidithiobacillus caldus]